MTVRDHSTTQRLGDAMQRYGPGGSKTAIERSSADTAEQARGATGGDASGEGTPPPAPSPEPGWPHWTRPAIVAGLLVIVLAVGLTVMAGAVERLNPFHNGLIQQRSIDRSGPAVLKAINDMGEYHAASGYYEVVVDVEHDMHPLPSFLAGERVLFVAAGTVDVAVDFRDLSPGAVTVNADRTAATIKLPPPELTRPNLDVGRSYVYSDQRGLIDRLHGALSDNPSADQRQLYTLASKRIAKAAAATKELPTRGETNTRAMLQGLLHSLGFTDVTVTFTAPPAA